MTASALSITDLKFRYSHAANSPWIVDIASLELARGEQMLLTGVSGGGKSTLLYLIAGLMEPNQGTIKVDGQDMHALKGEKRDLYRGSKIGMIFQTFNLLEGFTAKENILAAMMFSDIKPSEHIPRAEQLLKQLDIPQPNKLVDELSVGQQQRVAVARAMACAPVLVLADEPTASLDPTNAATAMDLIQQTCHDQGAALLCTSHDPSLAERFNRQAALESPLLQLHE
jgi:ABC-type lipoprotein export system ATPase subunit